MLSALSLQAMAIGHPHNMFAARKQLLAKELTGSSSTSAVKSAWKTTQEFKSQVTVCRSLASLLTKLAER